jgi:hypothetical protein
MSKFTDNLTMCDSEALLRSADRKRTPTIAIAFYNTSQCMGFFGGMCRERAGFESNFSVG